MIIYKTTNLINGKFYIGKDTKNNPNYLGSGKHLKRAIKKYGEENFAKETLEICENEKQLYEREKFWIKETRARELGYNIAEGGEGFVAGHPTSKEVREKISKSLMGHIPWSKGKHFSEETRKKMSEKKKNYVPWNKGKTGIYSESTLKKISENHRMKKEEERKKHSEFLRNSGIFKGKNNPFFGRTGEKHFFYGKKRPEHSEKMKLYWKQKRELIGKK